MKKLFLLIMLTLPMQLFAQQPTSREPGVGQRFCPPGSHPIDGYACELNIQPEGTKMEMCLTYEVGDRLNPDPKAAIPCSSRWATLENPIDEENADRKPSNTQTHQQPPCPQGSHREGSDPACMADPLSDDNSQKSSSKLNSLLNLLGTGTQIWTQLHQQSQPQQSNTTEQQFEQQIQHMSPELQRVARVYRRLLNGAPMRMMVCGPEDRNYPLCQTDIPLDSANAWAVRANKWLVFTKRGVHDLQSDDEVACIMAHEAG